MTDGTHLAIPHFEQVRRLGPDSVNDGPSGRNSYHQAALQMLVLCYEKVGDPIKTELTLKEMRVFYPDCESPEEHPAAASGEQSDALIPHGCPGAADPRLPRASHAIPRASGPFAELRAGSWLPPSVLRG